MSLTAEECQWIEDQMGGHILEVEEQPRWRPHYFVTLDKSGTTVTVVARPARQAEVVAHSRLMQHFNIAREAKVLAALQGSGVKVPRFFGYSDEHQIILMERLSGANELSFAADEEERGRVMMEYYEQLALLHGLDLEAMQGKIAELGVPTTPEDVALTGKFRFMELDYLASRPHMDPEPLLDLGVWWLHNNVPKGERRVTFVQGDTGPGQFMFADGHLTGLIDWELAHIGDPMLDIGVGRMRNMLYPTGPMRDRLHHYEVASGQRLDREAVMYYTVLSMLFTPLGTAKTAQRPSARFTDTLARLGWDVTLRRGLCDALAEVLSLTLEPPDLPNVPEDDERSLVSFLGEYIELHCLPVAHNPVERSKLESAAALARTLQLDSRVGNKLRNDDLADMAQVLGRSPFDRADGLAALSKVVDESVGDRLPDLLWLFSRMERRREYLWRPLMVAQASGDYEPLDSTAPPAHVDA